jgi:hypothetical protein
MATEFEMALAMVANPVPQPLEYRVYYDADTGTVVSISMEDQPGTYITVTREEFMAVNLANHVVKDGKLTMVDHRIHSVLKLKKTPQGEFVTLKNNIAFVATQGDHYGIRRND